MKNPKKTMGRTRPGMILPFLPLNKNFNFEKVSLRNLIPRISSDTPWSKNMT